MAPLSLKIVLDDGAVTRTIMFDTRTKVEEAHHIIRDKILTIDPDKEYGFFLTSADDDYSGCWLESDRYLEYYILKDGDSLQYLPKIRNLRLRMLDGSVKTLQVDESKNIQDLMIHICGRIGITNHEEYGLCREESEPFDESKSSTGTLTLRKKTVLKERDAQLEQLSKRLKTDDHVEWLEQQKTLRESRVDPKETLLFKRRLFYSDRNVDSRDPVQLNLLYVQTRDAILDGRQVVTEDKACVFAGIQCQVQYGDFQEDKHKPGFIENLKEFLPEQYASSWSIEKKIIKEHRQHQGVSQIEAKHLYIKAARALPTYGVTFFLVKEKLKGKKKLVPRLLGINSESILRLDEETKEILQVWLLTQVKSYKAGNESFTLNFGDYSDKEYAVKTNEAFRIKDILQGYIDIIRKRLAAPFNATYTEGEAMCEEVVETSRGTLTQNIVPMKVVEHSMIGPSRIISAEQGQQSQYGTQLVTVHEIITTRKGDGRQQALRGELRRTDSVSVDFRKKLNRLNSESVKTVVLLSDPTNENLQQVRKIVEGFHEELPSILKGVNETAATLKGEESKKLLKELDELSEYINSLAATTKRSDLSEPDNLMNAQDIAKKIADLSTQMYFSLNPETTQRSQLLSRTRNSFILDERTEASLRRASFLNATDNALQAVEQAKADIDMEYNGPPLSDEEMARLERKSADRLGKLNAALALLLNAHADPKNIDYEMAVNSMKTIHELMPDFIKDSKPLLSTGDPNSNMKFKAQIIQLLDGTQNMCMLTGSDDVNKMHDVCNAYADNTKGLIFTFNRRYPAKSDFNDAQNNEDKILALAKEAGQKASLLLMEVDSLNNLEPNGYHSKNLEGAGVVCADATQGLLACAKLTASSIHEPHCQSALTAAAENLSSSSQHLALAYKPLIEKTGRHGFAKQLTDRSFDLAKALDKLKDSYASLIVNEIPELEESETQNAERLKFTYTSKSAKNALTDADKQLQDMLKMPTTPASDTITPNARRLLFEQMGQLNAAITSLFQATSDSENPDYDIAGTAVCTISQLTPKIINGTKALHGSVDDSAWKEITENLKDILHATLEVCANAGDCNIEELNIAAEQVANSSRKLTFIFNPNKNSKKINEIEDLTRSAVDQTSQLLAKVDQLAKSISGDGGSALDTAGVKVVEAAKQLLKTAEITGPSIDDARCQAVLLSAIDRLSDSTKAIEDTWTPFIQTPKHQQSGAELTNSLRHVNLTLDKLKDVCQINDDNEANIHESRDTGDWKKQRLNFIATLSEAKKAMVNADKVLKDVNVPSKKTNVPTIDKNNISTVNNLTSQKLAKLNAAIANLLQAISDRERPDYAAAARAINTISSITPEVIKDSKSLHGSVDDNSWKAIMDDLKSIVAITNDFCDNADDPEKLKESASQVASSVGRLTFIFNPQRNQKKENEILDLSKKAVEQTSSLLYNVQKLAEKAGGVVGENLDEAGVKVVNSANILLKTAEITSPSINDTQCQEALLSSIDHLSDQADDLKVVWKPVIQHPEHRQAGNELNQNLNKVKETLDKLRSACLEPGKMETEDQKKQRLHFSSTLSKVKNAMTDAEKELEDAISFKMGSKIDHRAVPGIKNLTSQRLAKLNAAIASLIQATSHNPDYVAAAKSMNAISSLTPVIIKETKPLRGLVDDNSWKMIIDNLKSIVHTTKDICAKGENPKQLEESASKLAIPAGRLTFAFNPQKNQRNDDQILDLSRKAVEQTSSLLSNVQKLAESAGGEDEEKLDDAGVKVVKSAHTLLKTAEITSSSINDADCQTTLLSSIDQLSDQAEDLKSIWKPLVQNPAHRQVGNELDLNLNIVQETLDKLRSACQESGNNEDDSVGETEKRERETQHRQFVDSLSTAKKAMVDANKELKETLSSKKIDSAVENNTVPAIKNLTSQKLARLNAAIASLLQATSDRNKPNYEAAAKAMNTISSLTPVIIKDTKSLHGAVDDNLWKMIMDNLKSIVDTTNDICANVEDPEALKESASKFANTVGRLTYVFNPRNNLKKENQILDLSRKAVEQTSLLLSNVHQLAENTVGEHGDKQDKAGVKVVDSAQMLLKTAEITSPSISDSHCQEALLSSINQLSHLADDLKATWKPIVQTPKHRHAGDQLDQNLNIVQTTLDKLRSACQETEDPKAHQLNDLSSAKNKIKDAEKLFSEDKMAELRSSDTANKINKTNEPVLVQRRKLSDKLAQLNEAVALLLQAMLDRENPDYETAGQTISVISNLTPEVLQDTIGLHRNLDDNSREILFKEAKSLCDASQEICTSVENNSLEELNKAATKYAQSSGKLRFVISPRSYPNKEKQILDVTRSACERTSLMLSRVSRLAQNVGGEEGENLDKSGTRVADAAQVLLSNAQITASSINDPSCQLVLVSSAEKVSSVAQELETIWKPAIQYPKNQHIGDQITKDLKLLKNDLDRLKEICQDNSDFNDTMEITQQPTIQSAPKSDKNFQSVNNMKNIDQLLEDIYQNTKNDPIQKVEEIVIEDTPLRQLASTIMESIKVKAESKIYIGDERKRFADLANKLADAIEKLDISNAKCRSAPFDAKDKDERALLLENAILNLQLLCIHSRQIEGEQSNIVDLTEFVNDVTKTADDIQKATKNIKPGNGNEATMLKEIKNKCQKIQDDAEKLLTKQDDEKEDDVCDHILQIDQFAEECDDGIKEIDDSIRKISDENAKKTITDKLHSLKEKCDLLSFAAKSSIANAESATLVESLRNLEAVEKKIDVILRPVEGIANQEHFKGDNTQLIQSARASLAKVVATGNENMLPKALTRYAIQMKHLTNANDMNNKLESHLHKLLDILKSQLAEKNRRVMTWQDVDGEDNSKITKKVIQELESYAQEIEATEKHGAKGASKPIRKKVALVKEEDIKSLFSHSTLQIVGDEKELNVKFNQQIQKLSSMMGTIVLSLHKPDSLERSLHTTCDAAVQLSVIAKRLKSQDPVRNKRIEEAAKEMSVATYNLLRISEAESQSPNVPESRRRLLEACIILNDSLNNLARATVTGNSVERNCSELARSLMLKQSFLNCESQSNALSYPECVDALQNQQEIIYKLKSEHAMSRSECGTSARYVCSAVFNSAEYASQAAYLLSLSKEDQNVAKVGLVDVPLIKKLTDSINETCIEIMSHGCDVVDLQQNALKKQVQQLEEAINVSSPKMTIEDRKELAEHTRELKAAQKDLNAMFASNSYEEEKVTPKAMKLIEAANKIHRRINNVPQPKVSKDPNVTAMSNEVLDNTRSLISKSSMMIKKASTSEEEMMTWVMFGSSDVIKAFESLLICVREKGAEAGLIESSNTKEGTDAPVKSYVQTQLDSAIHWLRKPTSKESDKSAGVKGAESIVNIAEQMYKDLKEAEKEEMKQVITETNQLLKDCAVKYNSDKASLLMERLKELRKMLERGVVTRVVEDFLEEEPFANLEAVQKENDEKKRKYLLEKKIAELLAQLGRVKKTAGFIADTSTAPRQELMKISDQVELLAPALVKAAQQRVQSPDDKTAIEHYQKLLAEYAESLSKVRELCDKAVDPIDFSQAAGETMQRIKEETKMDPQRSVHSPTIILKLCKRVVNVGMNSNLVQKDPELKKTLIGIKKAVEEKQTESKRADWRDVTAEIMRRTGEVESALGGENIFLKQPEPDQPIYAAALDLHSAVRGWSARDNEIVAVAKRTAVHMARLSDYMNTGNNRELILTSNAIVNESRQVAMLARKLAMECSDIRIRTNLLQVCDRIPTISGQLKMLTTVKSSSLGHQGSAEDQEAMNMLVGNAQNLMISIQEVIKAAASASVKIMSQHGRRLKWIRRSYY